MLRRFSTPDPRELFASVGIAVIGSGIAVIGLGIAWILDHDLTFGIALIGVGIGLIGAGIAVTTTRTSSPWSASSPHSQNCSGSSGLRRTSSSTAAAVSDCGT